MHRSINLAADSFSLSRFASAGALRGFYESVGCDGIELVLCGENFEDKIRPGMVRGLHLVFYPEWISLWQDNFAALDAEFGDRQAWQDFYKAKNGSDLLKIYRHELDVAQQLGAEYVVFHVGDNRLREFFTLDFLRTDQEVIDVTAEFLNCLFDGQDYTLTLLLENLWSSGMTLLRPEIPRRLLEAIQYPRAGLLLDTGHLIATNPNLATQEEACHYIHQILDGLGPLCEKIYGMHLQCSLSGDYYREVFNAPPPDLQGEYLERFSVTIAHLNKIDPHRLFTSPGVHGLIERISPRWLTHELAFSPTLEEWAAKVKAQNSAIDGMTT